MVKFNPKTLKKNVVNESIKKYDNFSIVTKGNTTDYILPIEYIENLIDILYENKYVSLTSVVNNPELFKTFTSVITFAEALYNTDNYKYIRDLIDNKFDIVKVYEPYTIACYMKGHTKIDKDDEVEHQCNMYNVNTLLSANKEYNIPCNENILIAKYQDLSYNLTYINNNPKSNVLYLYVNADSLENMIGFNTKEIQAITQNPFLIRKGVKIEDIYIFGYKNSATNIKKLTNVPIKISNLKTRVDEIDLTSTQNTNNNNTYLYVACIILIILIIIILIYLMNR